MENKEREYSEENFKIPNYPNRFETLLDIHKELGAAKEQMMIDIILELIDLFDEDDSISQIIKDKLRKRLDELELSRKHKPKM